MRVACATGFMSHNFRAHWPDLEIIGGVDRMDGDYDLIIFTGGSDVNPAYYGEQPHPSVSFSAARDSAEFGILRRLLNFNLLGEHKRPFMLGVCRGLQILNVALGGSLVQDLYSEDRGHKYIHSLTFSNPEHPLAWLQTVNSLHHQGVKRAGKFPAPYVIATEPASGLPEIVTWGTHILGVQFHPELENGDRYHKFFSQISEWVEGKVSFNERCEYRFPRNPRDNSVLYRIKETNWSFGELTHPTEIEITHTDQNHDETW